MDSKRRILVVDDENRNIRLLEAMLIPLGYEVVTAVNGQEALERVKETSPDVILMDIMMPVMDGFEAARKLKEDKGTMVIPIVMVTALHDVEDRVKALEAGADDFLSKPVDKTELQARVQSSMKVKAYHDHMKNYQGELEVEVARRTDQLQEAFEKIKVASLDTIHRLSTAAEYKDEDTGAHIERMSRYAASVARKIGLNREAIEYILYAAPMHDVGKIGIPDNILMKPGKLDVNEWRIMKMHTVIGGRILAGAKRGFVKLGEVIALTHHEKWDGSGYPNSLKGRDIPLAGRVTAIADVFDALTSKRPYKEAWPVEEAFAEIRATSGSHFDPDVVKAFFAVQDEILQIRDQHPDEHRPSLYIQMLEEASGNPG